MSLYIFGGNYIYLHAAMKLKIIKCKFALLNLLTFISGHNNSTNMINSNEHEVFNCHEYFYFMLKSTKTRSLKYTVHVKVQNSKIYEMKMLCRIIFKRS